MIDVSSDRPSLLATISDISDGDWTGERPYINFVASNNLLVAQRQSAPGFRIYDVTNPSAPVVKASVPGSPIALSGSKLYLADASLLHVYDISDTASPVPVGSTPLAIPGSYRGASRVQGNYLVNIDGIFDITDPIHPRALPVNLAVPGPIDFLVNYQLEDDLFYTVTLFRGLTVSRLVAAKSFVDNFEDDNDQGWQRWPSVGPDAAASFVVSNGKFGIETPASQSPAITYPQLGAARLDANLSDVSASVDVTGWRTGAEDSSTISLQIRAQAHPQAIRSFYSAEFSPRPTPLAAGTAYSTHPNFAIVRVERNTRTVLAVQEFLNDTFSSDRVYQIKVKANGSILRAELYDIAANGKPLLSTLYAVDHMFKAGYVAVHAFDRNGMVGKSGSSVSFTLDNFGAHGPQLPPMLHTSAHSIYWSNGGEYILSSASSLGEPFSLDASGIASTEDGFLKTLPVQANEPHRFFRLEHGTARAP